MEATEIETLSNACQRAMLRFMRRLEQLYQREEAEHLLDDGEYWK